MIIIVYINLLTPIVGRSCVYLNKKYPLLVCQNISLKHISQINIFLGIKVLLILLMTFHCYTN